MKLVSSAFADGAAIPRRFTCDGENLSPPLQWSDAPAGTRSFALLGDPDAPAGTWHHWAAYDLPPTVTETVPRSRISSRRSTISGRPAMAARVHPMAMGRTTITFGCSPSRPTIFGHRSMRPALKSRERLVNPPSWKRSSSVGMRDSARWTARRLEPRKSGG